MSGVQACATSNGAKDRSGEIMSNNTTVGRIEYSPDYESEKASLLQVVRQREETVAIEQAAGELSLSSRLEEIEKILWVFIEGEDDCWYDHHGYCQAHGWLHTEPSCPVKRAREYFSHHPIQGKER